MEDLDYESKFSEMQKYIPFLDRVIEKLKNSDQDKPRKAQLEKMQTLHGLLNNKDKKLKVETLLKCETVLKKLHAKIEKSDDVIPSNFPCNPTNTNISSKLTKQTHITGKSESSKNKFVPNNNLIEIHTCPASPTHLGEEDFRPPVEIPTERRSSPVKVISSPCYEQKLNSREGRDEPSTRAPSTNVARFQNRSDDIFHSNNTNNHHKLTEPVNISRWSGSRDISPSSSSSSSHHRSSWCSTSASLPSCNQRLNSQNRNKSNYSSEEENWDEPEEESFTKTKPDPKLTASTMTSSSYSIHRDPKVNHHHRYHDKSNKPHLDHGHSPQSPIPPYSTSPNMSQDEDAFQNKVYHDTIYKYKKPDSFNMFMNPSSPEPRSMHKHSHGNIFNRLGEKIDDGFENFRIQVKNDKIKAKPLHKAITQTTPPPPPPPLLISTRPIDDVLKSPPLSADDIDDLLNESLEAAIEKQKCAKLNEQNVKNEKAHSLDAVRRKLALISRPPSPPRFEPPIRKEKNVDEPFYRRGQTQIKKPVEVAPRIMSELKIGSEESVIHPVMPTKPPSNNFSLSSPLSPPPPTDTFVERLALKYNPHKRRESVSRERPNMSPLPTQDSVDSLGRRSKQSSHRENLAAPTHTVDPRVSKINISNIPPLMSLPISPVPNVLPTINHFDPRLRNTHTLNKDHIPFSVPKPYTPIPSLLDLQINIPVLSNNIPAPKTPNFNNPIQTLTPAIKDPRKQKPTTTYADKFNPERNDKTERMKYLESKKNKPPEPKTYGEYRQSKCRQRKEVESPKTLQSTEQILTTDVPSSQPIVASTLDKMYRNADYGKEKAGSIHGFKIPKKPKPETTKTPDQKNDTSDPKTEASKNVNQKTEENLTKKPDEEQLESTNKPEEKTQNVDSFEKQEELSIEDEKTTRLATKKKVIPATKKKKSSTDTNSNATESELKIETPQNKTSKRVIDVCEAKTASEPESLDDSLNEERLVIDESESPNKSITDIARTEPKIIHSQKPKEKENVDNKNSPSPECETKTTQPSDEAEKEQEEEVKPRRMSKPRSTIISKEPSEETETRECESPSQTRTRCRSVSDIFSPTTDNSIVSTQNIISGKRRTRASINFNEKNNKKPVTPKVVSSTASNTPKPQTPKTRNVKTPETKQKTKKKSSVSAAAAAKLKDDIEKKKSEDGQICAVSSTTEGPHNESEIITDDIASPEEPSSSNAVDQTQPSLQDADNQTKQEFLEGFLMSIVDPATNKDRIIDMLKSVLDDKKLQQVKEILFSPEKKENKNIMEKKDEGEEEQHEQSKPRATRTKKNELDRLNEDIRDMFICQGVVTATGRRMCTIAKETAKNSPAQPKKKKVVQPKSDKSPVTPQPSCLIGKRRMRKAKVLLSPLNLRALRSRDQKTKSLSKMPVLQPNTPESNNIKSPEEIKDVKSKKLSKSLKKKPGPKSKRTSDSSDSSDDDIELVHLKNKIKRIDELKIDAETDKEIDKDSIEDKNKIDIIKEDDEDKNKVVKEDLSDKSAAISLHEETPKKYEDIVPKNTNPEFHTKSDYSNCCVICKEKARFIAPHYLVAHNDSEVYTSRLPPDVLEDLKRNVNNRANYSIPKKPQRLFNYMCPFCDFQGTCSLRGWMEHFSIHTGEYGLKCSGCFKAMNGCTHMMDHIKKYCPGAKRINREPINLRCHGIYGYVCHLCNFTQMLRVGVIRHLKVHHNLEDAESFGKIIEVKLIDTSVVPKKEQTEPSLSTTTTNTPPISMASVDCAVSKPTDSSATTAELNLQESLKSTEKEDVVVLSTSDDESAEENENKIKKRRVEMNMGAFIPQDLSSTPFAFQTEATKTTLVDEIIDSVSCATTVAMFADKPTVVGRNETVAGQSSSLPISSNMEVFLPRDLSSPTSLVLTESLKSIEKDDEILSDSDHNQTKPAEKRITIAEKLSQRFKSIEKQNIAEENVPGTEKTSSQRTKDTNEVLPTVIPDVDIELSEEASTSAQVLAMPEKSPVTVELLNDSDSLIIDEDVINKSSARDNENCSESDEGNQNEEDDNDNWEDIEITETTKCGSHKEKNKNKSIFQTLSRLYASIAPRKSSKKIKEKEKRKAEALERSEKTAVDKISAKKNSVEPVPEERLDPLVLSSSSKSTPTHPTQQQQQQQPKQQHHQIQNFSEFLPDSPGDSLDMLLTSNFNCLEGDGNSFPHLDLNDLDSSIFPLPEEQDNNIQDAIALAADMDHIKFDVLGNPLSLGSKVQTPPPQHLTSSVQHSTKQKIENIGFSLSGNSFKYYCMVKSCAFLFSDHPDGLQNHFLFEHPTLKWSGYCDTCKMQVECGDRREMKHMLDVHSRPRNEDSSDKPRIKFRRLTGDILSTDKQTQIDNLTNKVRSSLLDNTISTYPVSHVDGESSETESSLNKLSETSQIEKETTGPTLPKIIPPSRTPELSLSTMLQSEPKAMIPPKAPPKRDMDIPLFKNVSKEFTITNVAEGVTDNDLLNLVFKQAESAPGGIQISQVISLNAGGKSVSPIPLSHFTDRITSTERRNSPLLKEFSSSLRDTQKQSPRGSPKSNAMNSSITQQNFPGLKKPIARKPSFICCVQKCSFSSSIQSAMNEHILSHIRCDNNRDSLKCHLCGFIGLDTNNYFNHMAQSHSIYNSVDKPCASTVELTQKIQDILRSTSNQKKPSDKEESYEQASSSSPTPFSAPAFLPVSAPVPTPSASRTFAKYSPPVIAPAPVPAPDSVLAPSPAPASISMTAPVPVPISVEESNTDTSFSNKLRKIAEEIVAPTGLSEEQIWRCVFYPECEFPVTEKSFQTHLATHTNTVPTSFPSMPSGSSLHCPHCTVNYYRAAVLKAHMKTHSRHQYFCYACSCTTFGTSQQVQKHFIETHSLIGAPKIQMMIPEEKSRNSAFLVASDKELSSVEVKQFGEKLILDWERRKAINKTHFKPNEQYLLPLQPIFNNQVFCSVCNYKTKVRTNMFRHLQLHNQDVDVGSVDPVNPVPCLEKNEKHFDKMLNLACSSNAGNSMKPKESVKIPLFVPDTKRYVCGHPGCKYLTITDQMLRSHLNALHGHEKGYVCPHCQEELCKKNMCAERIVQHLKFHGNKMYQCGECEYFHYTKHVVERHINEKHPGIPSINLINYDRSENEIKKSTQIVQGKNVSSGYLAPSECDSTVECVSTSNIPANTKMKWECALCKHQTATRNQIISHANSMHNAKHQYHCVHCTFGSAHLVHIMDHIDSKHPSKIREAKYVFYKINETLQDKAADTRPLWSRNDPKRVRSIRGILMENEEDAELVKKSLSHAGVDSEDDDEEVIVPVSDVDSSMIPDGLACFHCNFTSVEISSLSHHWKTKHWYEKNNEMVPRVPFFFRVHTVLKCPLCTHVGDQIALKIHLINVHGQRNFCAADPNLPNTCGHCSFVYPMKRLDVLSNHYLREHKPADAKHLSSGLLKNLLALGECQVYMQCYFCAEICPDKASIIEHERERHKNSNFRYKQIKDEVIFRCGMCQYSSTNELATLRHMIDHFPGFNVCHFCKNIQSSFNSYMQHCYTSHMKALPNFKEIYTFEKVASFLEQILLIFPNGLIAAKKNLLDTQYGNTERIQAMYYEICKKALEPPIPPLCMGRLLAKKSVESSTLLPPPPVTVSAKRIAKRRSTVAMGGCEREMLSGFTVPSGPQNIKKRKSSICGDFQQPTAPLFSTITVNSNDNNNKSLVSPEIAESKCSESQGFSFYGQKPDPIDLSKVYTHIAIGDKYAPVSVKKFSLLFKINTKVMVENMNYRNYEAKKRTANYCRPCPASKKKRLA